MTNVQQSRENSALKSGLGGGLSPVYRGDGDTLFLISQSANMLARSARRGGWRPLSLDRFADEDTRRVSEHAEVIPRDSRGVRHEAIIAAIDRLDPSAEAAGIVYGSGVDCDPLLLESLATKRRLYGNSAALVRRIRTPGTFFSLLDDLNIPYPEICLSVPADPAEWLVKKPFAAGGEGVALCEGNISMRDDLYFQRFVAGDSVSVLFLADGRSARVVGYNTQWTFQGHPHVPFLFAGVVNWAKLNGEHRASLRRYVARLVEATGLVGLNTLDCILHGNCIYVLEINPRIGASAALYDEDYANGLLAGHIAACEGIDVTASSAPAHPPRGYEIVYTRRDVSIPKIDWPDWCSDLPAAGLRIAAGTPICSIHACAASRSAVLRLLNKRKRAVMRLLAGGRH